ncbi:MAG: D-glycero-beta-D-manno-heptose 1-phosphate adenylyltransferase [Bacteroidales bacterium]|nr:D-glycero-beta-D-manno-heptose 1-phosphate adenylyltransferase [Bacteroidales bacterium]
MTMNKPDLHIHQKIVSRDFFRENALKLHRQKIVFTNGCFDVLHYGHVRYLLEAKKLGDILVVGLNSDESVRRLKGPTRPVNGEKERAFVLAALACIDYVVIFGEDTPKELIETVIPDVLVKGGDYDLSNIVGADFVTQNGGTVTTIPFVEGFSSTHIIEQLKTE